MVMLYFVDNGFKCFLCTIKQTMEGTSIQTEQKYDKGNPFKIIQRIIWNKIEIENMIHAYVGPLNCKLGN